ncbi:MAG: RsmB/NOP family class I SAM-dependent RNA methyltransferase [Alphaproteobacteria bacterium]|nr:RsmB/NOP family class I SAM-dependent RNA methyltransferase [Alphaproteobacteria bacterium]
MIENREDYAEVLKNILHDGLSFSAVKNEFKEKSFANMLFMTAFRNLTFIKTEVLPLFVKKKIPQKQNILEFILYLGITEILFMNTPDYAIINSYVDVAKSKTDKFGANFVNAVLRNVLRKKDELLKNRKTKYFSKKFLEILKQDYKAQEIEDMEKYANIEPMLDITTKHNIDQSIYNDATLLPSGSVRFAANTIVENIAGFANGDWWVQDVSSSLCVKSLSNLKGKKVLDLCAAPGGKTAQLLDAGAIVTAVDISETRLNKLKENIERLRLESNLKIICSDILDLTLDEKFDIVLLDAPCSATGTFRRHPEIINTKTLSDIKKLASLQEKLLIKASSFVKQNGILLYSTCSLSKKEGELQIKNFIKNNDNYKILPINLSGINNSITKEGFIRVLPQHFDDFLGADGFFIASLQRKN